MLLAPGSQAETNCASTHQRKIQAPRVLNGTAGALAIFLLLLPAWPARTLAQQAVSPFEDLAARAAAARDQQNLSLAIDLYGQAEQLNPSWAEGWFYLGLLHYSSNGYAAAIDAFNHFLQLQPGAAPALALRGLCEFETGVYDDSLRDLEQGVKNGAANEPRNEQIIRYHFAQLLTRAGRFEDAIAQYQFFASKHIDDPDLLAGLGLAGMRIPSLSKEIAAERRGLMQEVGRAGYSFLAGDDETADRQFNQLIALYPTAPELYFFYGRLLFRHGSEEAIDRFRREVILAPGNTYAHAMLAYSLMLTGRYREAVPEAEIAVTAAPDLELARLALGASLAETGDDKRATEMLNLVLKQDPNNLEAHMALAAMYSRAGRREDAYRERMECLGLAH
jgi:tetratricopeptide (TPR) repeat protein